MRGMNRVTLIGRLGRHPELRESKAGGRWCTLSVATDRYRKDGETWKTETDWHRVKVFGVEAEKCEQMLRSGSLVSVEGSMQYEKWQDDDGKPRTSAQVLADRIGFLTDLREQAGA